MRTISAIALLLASACIGQAADNLPRFEAATLKQAPPPTTDAYPITLGLINGSRLNLTNVTLSDCFKFAYGLVSDDQIKGPDWMWSKDSIYDIVAVVPANASREQVMVMTRSLLADRMHVILHQEQKEMKYLALTPGKNGPKMTAADLSQERNNSGGKGRVTGNRVSMPLLATLLSRMEHQIVIDRTGIDGEFAITLSWVPGSGGTGAISDDSVAGASLFSAVQEQLGLKLEARKGPLDIVVVDSADKVPAEN
jgi:uncharacterized protein (TIGR03435 family)